MFKSILPTAKRADPKDGVATAGEGKENSRPGSFPQRSPTKPVYSAVQHSFDGKRTVRPTELRESAEPLATDREFEKLLVRIQQCTFGLISSLA